MPLTPSQRQARMRAKRKRYEEALREIALEAGKSANGADDYRQGYIDGLNEAATIARAALTPDKETQG